MVHVLVVKHLSNLPERQCKQGAFGVVSDFIRWPTNLYTDLALQSTSTNASLYIESWRILSTFTISYIIIQDIYEVLNERFYCLYKFMDVNIKPDSCWIMAKIDWSTSVSVSASASANYRMKGHIKHNYTSQYSHPHFYRWRDDIFADANISYCLT